MLREKLNASCQARDLEVGAYRKLFPKLFHDPRFAQLSVVHKVMFFYLLCGPQSNRIGIYRLSAATAAEDLGQTLASVRKSIDAVTRSFDWHFDRTAMVLWIPTWWRYNHPQNENVFIGNLKDVAKLPKTPLLDAFAANVEWLDIRLHATFRELMGRRSTKGYPGRLRDGLGAELANQKQYQVPGTDTTDQNEERRSKEEVEAEVNGKVPRADARSVSTRETESLSTVTNLAIELLQGGVGPNDLPAALKARCDRDGVNAWSFTLARAVRDAIERHRPPQAEGGAQ